MGKINFTVEQIIIKLREVEVLCSKGKTIGEAVRQIGVTEQTYYRWRKQYGKMTPSEAKRLKELARTRLWKSGQYQPVVNTATIVTHGLTIANPEDYQCDIILKCITNDNVNGYSAGDIATGWSNVTFSSNVYSSHSNNPSLNATTIRYNTGNDGITVLHKTNGIRSGITIANWRYIFRIWY